MLSIWTKFESDLRQLLSNAVETRRLSAQSAKAARGNFAPETSENIRQVITDLNDYIASAQDGSGMPLTLKEQANAIDRLINKHIRPHSAERWRQAELIWPKIRQIGRAHV